MGGCGCGCVQLLGTKKVINHFTSTVLTGNLPKFMTESGNHGQSNNVKNTLNHVQKQADQITTHAHNNTNT